MSNGHGSVFSRINRYPRAFLSLLDSAAEGQTPHLLPQYVQPAVEMTEFYDLTQLQAVNDSTSATLTAVGGYFPTAATSSAVPDGEVWKVLAIDSKMNALAAGTTYRLSVAASMAGRTFTLGAPQTFTAGEAVALGWTGQLWFLPGDRPGIYCHAVTLGTAGLAFPSIRFVRYRG